MRKSVTIISVTLTLLFITKSASALTLSEVLRLTPAFHVIEEIYVKIAGSYYPISEWVQFTSHGLSVKKQVRIDNLKSCGKLYTDSSGNVKCGVDQVNDADPNPTNELQTLYRSGNRICISKTGSCVTVELKCITLHKSFFGVVDSYCPAGYFLTGCSTNCLWGSIKENEILIQWSIPKGNYCRHVCRFHYQGQLFDSNGDGYITCCRIVYS